MSTQPSLYRYQPLPTSTSIRLVKLTVHGTTQDVSCNFEVVDLSKDPIYIALSYYWGDATNLEPIVCDGQVIMVTRTIRTMLKRFDNVAVGLWCDALCINQSDIEERNQQVSIMADIYSKATTVNVWLGLDSHKDAKELKAGFQKLFNTLQVVDEMGATFKWIDLACGELHATLPTNLGSARIEFPLPSSIFWAGYDEETRLKRFFSLPWFSRTWVMQEVGLAKEVKCFWGDVEMDWDMIGIVAMFLVRYGTYLSEKIGIVELVANIHYLYTAYSPFTPMKTFFHLLNNSKRFRATDPRDKVFALLSHPTSGTVSIAPGMPVNAARYEPYLSLAKHFQPSMQDQSALKLAYETKGSMQDTDGKPSAPHPALIKADYNKPASQVYLELATSHIECTNSLEILTAVQHDPYPHDLPIPSWIPQWDKHISAPTLGLYTSMFTAAANRPPIFALPSLNSSTGHNLVVRGAIVSRVFLTSDLLEDRQFELPIFPDPDPAELASAIAAGTTLKTHAETDNPVATMWIRMGLGPLHESGQLYTETMLRQFQDEDDVWYGLRHRYSIWSAYLRTWVAGGNGLDTSVVDVEDDGAEYWWRLFPDSKPKPEPRPREVEDKVRREYDDDDDDDDDYYDDEESDGDDDDDEEAKAKEDYMSIMAAGRYRAAAARVSNQRRFFMIKKGLFGLGPGAMRKGDWLAILLGADVPFILREIGAGNRPENQGFAEDIQFQLVGECFCFGLMEGQAAKLTEVNRDIVLV